MKTSVRLDKKIVFATPPLSTKERYGISEQSGGETMPIGLVSLAAVTRQFGYPTAIVDAEILKLDTYEATQRILALKPDYVGFTAVTVSIFNAAEVARLLKQNKEDIICIIGGHHISALPEETLNLFPAFDIGVIGEGETTIVELLDSLRHGFRDESLREVKGIVFKLGDQLIKTEKRERIKDLDSLPRLALDLLPDIPKYYCPPVHTVKRLPATNMVTSRGCTGKCLFCAREVYKSTLSYHSASRIMDIIKDLYHNYKIREIQFRDDDFFVFRKRLRELCCLLIDEKMDLVWSCTGRADFVNPQILDLMKKAGCWQIWYGVEAGSQEVLNMVRKGITLEQIIKAVTWTRESGIEPCGFFMMGNPGETRQSLCETIDFALKLDLSDFNVSFTTPFPGSELYTTYKKYGTFENNWKKMHGWTPLFIPYGLTKEELKHFSNKLYIKFYFRFKSIWRYIRKIKGLRNLRLYIEGFLALIQYLKIKEKNECVPR